MKEKKFLSIVLGILIVLQCFPFFVTGSGISPHLKIKKEAMPTLHLNEYEVTIDAENLPVVSGEPQGIVFVLDISHYDAQNGALREHIEILQQLLPQICSTKSQDKIALVLVAKNITQTEFFTGENLSELLDLLEQIQPQEGCYLEEGIRQGGQMLASLDDVEQKSLVVLSSGKATYSSKVKSIKPTIFCEPKGNPFWSYHPSYVTPTKVIGDGVTPDGGLMFHQVVVGQGICQYGETHKPIGEQKKFPTTHGQLAVCESQKLQENYSVYSVALHSDGIERSTMENISSTGEVLIEKNQAVTQLKEILLSGKTSEFLDITLQEEFGPLVELLPETLSVTEGFASYEDGTLLWSFDRSGQLTYTVRLNVTHPEFLENTNIPLAESGVAFYQLQGEEKQFIYKQPTAKGYCSEIYLQGVLVNREGELLDELGNIALSIDDAQKLTSEVAYLNEYGENRWRPNSLQVVLNKLTNINENFELFSETEQQKEIMLENSSQKTMVYFYYKTKEPDPEEPIPYQVKVYLDDVEDPTFREIGEVLPNHTELLITPDLNLYPKGKFVCGNFGEDIFTEPHAVNITKEKNEIHLYYESIWHYEIFYYYDEVMQNSDIFFTTIASPTISILDNIIIPSGLELEKIIFEDQTYTTFTDPLFVSLTKDEQIFQVFFKTPEKETPPEEKPSIPPTEVPEEKPSIPPSEKPEHQKTHSIQYYYDGNFMPELTKTINSASDEMLLWDDSWNNDFNYYQYPPIVTPTLPAVLSDNEIITVTYQLKEDAELPYTIFYYKDGTLSREDTEMAVLHAGDSFLNCSLAMDKEKYKDYQYSHMKLTDSTGNIYETDENHIWQITPNRNQIHIFYTKGEERPEIYEYQVEHYYNNQLQPSLTEYKQVPKDTVIETVSVYETEQMKQTKIEPPLPISIQGEHQVIKVYYQSQPDDKDPQKPSIPNKPTPKPPINPEVPTVNDMQITLYYQYRSNLGIAWEEQEKFPLNTKIDLWSTYETMTYQETSYHLTHLMVYAFPKRLTTTMALGESGREQAPLFAEEYEIKKGDMIVLEDAYDYMVYFTYEESDLQEKPSINKPEEPNFPNSDKTEQKDRKPTSKKKETKEKVDTSMRVSVVPQNSNETQNTQESVNYRAEQSRKNVPTVSLPKTGGNNKISYYQGIISIFICILSIYLYKYMDIHPYD